MHTEMYNIIVAVTLLFGFTPLVFRNCSFNEMFYFNTSGNPRFARAPLVVIPHLSGLKG